MLFCPLSCTICCDEFWVISTLTSSNVRSRLDHVTRWHVGYVQVRHVSTLTSQRAVLSSNTSGERGDSSLTRLFGPLPTAMAGKLVSTCVSTLAVEVCAGLLCPHWTHVGASWSGRRRAPVHSLLDEFMQTVWCGFGGEMDVNVFHVKRFCSRCLPSAARLHFKVTCCSFALMKCLHQCVMCHS